MAIYTLDIYDYNPSGIFSTTVSDTFTYAGPATATGTATITDTQSGLDGQTLSALYSGETATADVTVGGHTSTGSNVDAEDAWTLRDTTTGEIFQVTSMEVRSGDADGKYLVSEYPMVAGHTYEVLAYNNLPSTSSGPILNYTEVVCFAPGTLILTPAGEVPVERLRVGDLVQSLDHGPVPIRWVRSGNQPLDAAEIDAKPVLISAGAFGGKLPGQDLIVSPQHRILVGGHRQLQGLFQTEALAPAKSLTSLRGIRHMKGKQHITWIHFACERHEVVTANGCLSESLLLGPMVVNGLTAPERQAVIDIFGPAPTPDAALNGPPARECLKAGAVRRQLAKSSEAQKKLVAKETRKWDVDLAMEQYEAELMREAKAMNQPRRKSVA